MTSAPSRPDGQPHLRVESAGTTRTYDVDRVVIGREADCDVVVSEPSASRHHAVVQREGDGWVVVDTSSNGTFVRGQRITRMAVPMNPLSLHLGGPAGEAVVVSLVEACRSAGAASGAAAVPTGGATPPPYEPSPPAPDSEWWRNLPPPQLPAVAAPADAWQPQDVVPPGQLAARPLGRAAAAGRGRQRPHHRPRSGQRRRARRRAGQPAPRAARPGRPGPGRRSCRTSAASTAPSSTGAGCRGRVQLAVGAEVIFGNQTFRWDGTQLLASATTHEFTLYADGLTTVLPGGKPLLQNASFQLKPSSLTAVIGPSGAGKSTLLERAHRTPAGDARPGDLAGPRPLRALRPAPVPDRPGAAAGHPAPAAEGAPGAAVRRPAPAAAGHDPRRSRTTGSVRWPTSSS